MKLGTHTGSLVNHIYSRSTKGQPEPTVGMGVTILHWSDRSTGTIVEVFKIKNDWAIAVTGDDYKIVSGSTQDGSAEYEYISRMDSPHRSYWRFTEKGWGQVRKNEDTGRWLNIKGNGLIIGKRDRYYDPSF